MLCCSRMLCLARTTPLTGGCALPRFRVRWRISA
jgi:hypothetical protein